MTAAVDSAIWTEELTIRSSDVDFRHLATVETLCRIFLEAAWNHARELGVGFEQLATLHKFWVLSRVAVRIDKYPRWGDRIKLKTWPRGTSSIFALRDFEIEDGNQARLAAGASAWLVLDSGSKRPQRVDKLAASIQALPERRAVDQELQKLPRVEDSNKALTLTAAYSAIDVNGHVNSARYIGWILDSYSFGFHHKHLVREFEVNYLGETIGGELVSILTMARAENEFLHSLIKSNGQEVCRARVLWSEQDSKSQAFSSST